MKAVDMLNERIEALIKEIDVSAAKHNSLIGALNEAKSLLVQLQAQETQEVIEIVE